MAKVKRGKQVFAEINITPLTDVCLVLLIIFMVTATFLTQSAGLDVALPKTPSAATLPAKRVELTVTRDGSIYLDGKTVAQPDLAAALQAKLQESSLKSVVIQADADVPYKHVVDAMGAASSLGADITLAAEAQEALARQAKP
jgi:biopolymer transport protein ExbD